MFSKLSRFNLIGGGMFQSIYRCLKSGYFNLLTFLMSAIALVSSYSEAAKDLTEAIKFNVEKNYLSEQIQYLKASSAEDLSKLKLENEAIRREIEQKTALLQPQINSLNATTSKLVSDVSLNRFASDLRMLRELRPVVNITGSAKFRRDLHKQRIMTNPSYILVNTGKETVRLSSVKMTYHCDGKKVTSIAENIYGTLSPGKDLPIHPIEYAYPTTCSNHKASLAAQITPDPISLKLFKQREPELYELFKEDMKQYWTLNDMFIPN